MFQEICCTILKISTFFIYFRNLEHIINLLNKVERLLGLHEEEQGGNSERGPDQQLELTGDLTERVASDVNYLNHCVSKCEASAFVEEIRPRINIIGKFRSFIEVKATGFFHVSCWLLLCYHKDQFLRQFVLLILILDFLTYYFKSFLGENEIALLTLFNVRLFYIILFFLVENLYYLLIL